MRIAIPLVMKCPVGNHTFRNEVFLNVIPDTFNLLSTGHLNWKCDFHFPGKLGIGPLLNHLHFVPQELTVKECCRCMIRNQDLIHDDSGLSCEVMQDSGLIIQQLFTGPVCGRSNCRAAGGAADDLNGAVVDGHALSPSFR